MSDKNNLKPDPVLKDFWSDNNRFADLFNQVFFQGKAVIIPDKLSDKDTEESTVFMEKKQVTAISRSRDVIKQHLDGAELVLVAMENQMKIHYAMPVRSMLYDALRYTRQCKELERAHRRDKELKQPEEFLSGMTRTDRLQPVISLVVYYGEKPWDGPTALSDMMDIPPLFRPLFSDQKLNLLQMRDTGEMKFDNADNQDFFTMIKEFYENNGHIDISKLKEKYPDKEIYWETMAAIGAATGSGELVDYARRHKGGRLNMCTALENLKQEGRLEGRIEGMVTAYRELEIPDDIIIQKLQEKCSLSYEEAKKVLVGV